MSPRNQKQNEQMRRESLEKITGSAFKIFSEYGYHGATLKKITKATGLSYGLVYHYFPSKEKIFLHLVDLAFDYSNSILDRALTSPGTAWEKLQFLSETLASEIQSENLSYYFIITQQAMTQATDITGIRDILENKIYNYSKIDDLILQAQKSGDVIEGDPGILSAAYLALFQGLTLMTQYQSDIKSNISPAIFNNLLRKKK